MALPIEFASNTLATEVVLVIYRQLFPGASTGFITKVFADIESMFTGKYLDYASIDLAYHDLKHTLQVAVAYADILRARQLAGEKPAATSRHFELGLIAALLHDSGYLKVRADHAGTGAKYTFCHVLRSCALAASYLPSIGLKPAEIDTVLAAVRATGPAAGGMNLRYHNPEDHMLACAVATADYLAQMASEDYPDKLRALYAEFNESDAFLNLPIERRAFCSFESLMAGSTGFWKRLVLPKLDNEFHSIYRYLATPDGFHPYIDAIERNLRLISQRATLGVN
jgi:hypothetical protein